VGLVVVVVFVVAESVVVDLQKNGFIEWFVAAGTTAAAVVCTCRSSCDHKPNSSMDSASDVIVSSFASGSGEPSGVKNSSTSFAAAAAQYLA
jgi:hypothetical protein